MKHIITTVGTSIFSNLRHEDVTDCWKCYSLSPLPDNTYKSLMKHDGNAHNYKVSKGINPIQDSENFVKRVWLKDTYFDKQEDCWEYKVNSSIPNTNASAEIKSICKIIEESDDTEFTIYLICSDTAICMSAGYLVKAFFEEVKPKLKNGKGEEASISISEYSPSPVDSLDIEKRDSFIDIAIYNLISKLDKVQNQKTVSHSDVILNISGGYKALIPIITIYAQIRKNDLAYIYEDSDELIVITPFPLQFDNSVYYGDSLLIRPDLLKGTKYILSNEYPKSEIKANFQKLIDRQRNAKLVKLDKVQPTTLGAVLRSLSQVEVENDFGDKIIEPALLAFFNNSTRQALVEYNSARIKIRVDKELIIAGCNDVSITEIDIQMIKNNDCIKSKNSCTDYFHKMKGRILLHNDFESFKDKPIEFLYIVYSFQFDAYRNSLKQNQSVEHFRKRFAEDEELKKLDVSFRALGLTIPIEDPLNFNYLDFKKDWTKCLYQAKNWEEL